MSTGNTFYHDNVLFCDTHVLNVLLTSDVIYLYENANCWSQLIRNFWQWFYIDVFNNEIDQDMLLVPL